MFFFVLLVIMCLTEETSATGHEGLDQSSEGWLADCFNNDEMHCSPDDLYISLNFSIQSSSSSPLFY
ncbi:unnamed protein product [Camellia sinensis]